MGIVIILTNGWHITFSCNLDLISTSCTWMNFEQIHLASSRTLFRLQCGGLEIIEKTLKDVNVFGLNNPDFEQPTILKDVEVCLTPF